MKRCWTALLMLVAVSAFAQDAVSQDDVSAFNNLPWVIGPEVGELAGQASIALKDQYAFLGEHGASKFLELTGNPPRAGHYVLLPRDESDWFAVFHFSDEGYVKDGESLDADALLKSLKEADGPSNEERKSLGMGAVYTDGWEVEPHYDPATRRLEWGVRLRDEKGRINVNYSSRLLGREGVMSAVLVSDPERLAADRVAFNAALEGFDFKAGKRYSEFREGDKMAAYGLGALVLGGAAAAVAKTGGGKAFFKAILLALAAGGAAVWAFVKRFLGRRKDGSAGSHD